MMIYDDYMGMAYRWTPRGGAIKFHHSKWLGPIEMGPKNFSRYRRTTNHVEIGRESQPGSSIFYIVYIVYISLIDIIDGVIHKSCYPTDGDLKRQKVSGFFQKKRGAMQDSESHGQG